MANIFNSVKLDKPKSNVFDLSHDVKLSFDMGELVPVNCIEVVPGDKFNMETESMIRLAPMIAPVMHKVDVYTHHFFVPNRILWDGWEEFITKPNDPEAPAFPKYKDPQPGAQFSGFGPGSLGDYLGYPCFDPDLNIGMLKWEDINLLPFAAYQKIYNEYYRDQNLQPEVIDKLVSGDNIDPLDETALMDLRKRAWRHDYFTAALPFAQKGDVVGIPLAIQDLPIKYDGLGDTIIRTEAGDVNALLNIPVENEPSDTVASNRLYADGSNMVQSSSINDLRLAFRLQEWLEKSARAGSRYVESLLAHFGVRSSDKRLQRPEYIGGSRTPIVMSEVLQTSGSNEDSPQGNMAGHGISFDNGQRSSYFAEEHGFIISIMSVLPQTSYQQGIPKMFLKRDPLDYYWPTFAHLGEQAILNKELYYDKSDDQNDEVFGYIPRYSEYKYAPSRVAGDFKKSLAFWHMGRIFEERPHLNADFIESDPTTRIFAVSDEEEWYPKLWCHVYNRVKAIRRMPKFGTPSF